jgi:hypothetical protein
MAAPSTNFFQNVIKIHEKFFGYFHVRDSFRTNTVKKISFCEHFWVNKSLSVMWEHSSVVYHDTLVTLSLEKFKAQAEFFFLAACYHTLFLVEQQDFPQSQFSC